MTDQLRLRPVAKDDLELLDRLAGDPEAAGEYAWWGHHDHGHARQWEQNRMLGDDGGVLIAAYADESVGFVAWRRRISWAYAHCWAISATIRPDRRGRGHGTAAQGALARYLFATTSTHRIDAETEAENLAERRALEKAGFTREGVLRGVAFRGGRWRDGVMYSVLRTDLDPAELESLA